MTTHLKAIRAENFKRLTLADVTFDESGTFSIMGSNEAGKSSLLDALESTIAGRRAQTFIEPVHVGADAARIIATFDDIIVTRTIKARGGTAIEVKGVDGRRFSSSEEVLRSLYTHVALDPLAFSRLSDKEQVNTLLPMIGYDPTELDAAGTSAFIQRTDATRELKALEARLAALPTLPPETSAESETAVDLADQLAKALGSNSARESALETVFALVDKIAELTASLRSATEEHTRLTEGPVPAVVDVEAIRVKIAAAQEAGRLRAERKEQAYLSGEVAAKAAEVAKLTGRLSEVKAQKVAALAAAPMPVPGLTVDPETDTLLLDGTPFSQASTGVKIRTGAAIAIALNPDLKLIVIRDASLLDTGNRAALDELAKEHGFLILMEIADTNEPVGVVIEAGEVVEVRK
jgi:hypothetical protein